jgi:hypothetical protein
MQKPPHFLFNTFFLASFPVKYMDSSFQRAPSPIGLSQHHFVFLFFYFCALVFPRGLLLYNENGGNMFLRNIYTLFYLEYEGSSFLPNVCILFCSEVRGRCFFRNIKYTRLPWRSRQLVPLKHWYTHTPRGWRQQVYLRIWHAMSWRRRQQVPPKLWHILLTWRWRLVHSSTLKILAVRSSESHTISLWIVACYSGLYQSSVSPQCIYVWGK